MSMVQPESRLALSFAGMVRRTSPTASQVAYRSRTSYRDGLALRIFSKSSTVRS